MDDAPNFLFTVMGLGEHAFADPYRTIEYEDGEPIEDEACGVLTPSGSPCGYPRSMHRQVPT